MLAPLPSVPLMLNCVALSTATLLTDSSANPGSATAVDPSNLYLKHSALRAPSLPVSPFIPVGPVSPFGAN